MPSDRVNAFLRAKNLIRAHPDWDDEQIADQLGIPRALIDETVAVARREVETAG